jgi:hypothetical protein
MTVEANATHIVTLLRIHVLFILLLFVVFFSLSLGLDLDHRLFGGWHGCNIYRSRRYIVGALGLGCDVVVLCLGFKVLNDAVGCSSLSILNW